MYRILRVDLLLVSMFRVIRTFVRVSLHLFRSGLRGRRRRKGEGFRKPISILAATLKAPRCSNEIQNINNFIGPRTCFRLPGHTELGLSTERHVGGKRRSDDDILTTRETR